MVEIDSRPDYIWVFLVLAPLSTEGQGFQGFHCQFMPEVIRTQGRIQKIQKEGAEETDDAVLHHSGRICDQTLRRNVKNFLKRQERKGERGSAAPSLLP